MQNAPWILVVLVGVLASCRINKAVPLAKQLPVAPHGAEFLLLNKQGHVLQRGELLALTPDTAYVLTPESTLLRLAKTDAPSAQLNIALTSNKPNSLRTWVGLTNMLTLSHGWLLGATLPINLAVTSVVGAGAGRAYQIDYPEQVGWQDMSKFARFPQGLPPQVPLSQLR